MALHALPGGGRPWQGDRSALQRRRGPARPADPREERRSDPEDPDARSRARAIPSSWPQEGAFATGSGVRCGTIASAACTPSCTCGASRGRRALRRDRRAAFRARPDRRPVACRRSARRRRRPAGRRARGGRRAARGTESPSVPAASDRARPVGGAEGGGELVGGCQPRACGRDQRHLLWRDRRQARARRGRRRAPAGGSPPGRRAAAERPRQRRPSGPRRSAAASRSRPRAALELPDGIG